MKFIDLTNKTFGRWTVLEKGSYTSDGHIMWKCQCSCGLIKEVMGKTLINGSSKGCKRCQVTRHGMSRSPSYKIWAYMIARCCNPKDTAYKYYGDKGVKVCESWREDFLNFYKDMGDRPENLTLDRIDPFGNYCKKNCRWATKSQQNSNQRGSLRIGDVINGWKITGRSPNRASAFCIKCKREVERYVGEIKNPSRKCHCPSLR